MPEAFLHYIWRTQLFERQGLRTLSGASVEVLHPGYLNHDAGPDFWQAKLRIAGQLWVGKVEIHIRSRDWGQHGHQHDTAYEGVVLHVVWSAEEPSFAGIQPTRPNGKEAGMGTLLPSGLPMPVLALEGRVAPFRLERYQALATQAGLGSAFPCSATIAFAPTLAKVSQLDRALATRLEAKGRALLAYAQNPLAPDWEELAYLALARAMATPINADAFAGLAYQLPTRTVRRLGTEPMAALALVLGTAGCFVQTSVHTSASENAGEQDTQTIALLKEYAHQRHRLAQLLYREGEASEAESETAEITQYRGIPLRYSRMRPATFPDLRLAQLTSVVLAHPSLATLFLSDIPLSGLLKALQQPAHPYFENRYKVGRPGNSGAQVPGKSAAGQWALNAVIPFRIAYALANGNAGWYDAAHALLYALPAEDDRITRLYAGAGLPNESAADSQALHGLAKHFCTSFRCLECSIGHALVSTPTTTPTLAPALPPSLAGEVAVQGQPILPDIESGGASGHWPPSAHAGPGAHG
jgi:hypothetical protein